MYTQWFVWKNRLIGFMFLICFMLVAASKDLHFSNFTFFIVLAGAIYPAIYWIRFIYAFRTGAGFKHKYQPLLDEALALAPPKFNPKICIYDRYFGNFYLGIDPDQNSVVLIHRLDEVKKVLKMTDITRWEASGQNPRISFFFNDYEYPGTTIALPRKMREKVIGQLHVMIADIDQLKVNQSSASPASSRLN